jgi:hypothetical protein
MLRICVLSCAGAIIILASHSGTALGYRHYSSSGAELNPVAPHRPNPQHVKPRTASLLVHTTTIANDGHFDNGNVSKSDVNRWVSYAEGAGQTAPDKAVTDGDHCANTCSMFYTDFARLDPSQHPASDFLADPLFRECSGVGSPAAIDWVLHTLPPPACSSSTRTQPKPGHYNGNYGALTGIGAAFLSYIQGTYACCASSNWNLHDFIFQDTTSVDQFHDTQCCAATLEFANNTTYSAALFAFEDSLVHVAGGPFTAGQAYMSFLNGFSDGETAMDTGDVVCSVCTQDFGSSHVAGGECELCLQNGSPGAYYMFPLFVPYTVNTASVVIGAGGASGHQYILFTEYNSRDYTGQVGASFEDRYLTYSTYMLYYQPNHSTAAILGEDFDKHASSSTFNGVFPEQALVGYGTPALALVPYVSGNYGLGGCDPPNPPQKQDSGGIAAYLIATTCVHRSDGRYLGEYGQIYSSGSYPTSGLSQPPASIGPIAFVINLTDAAKTVPCAWFTGLGYTQNTFTHEILISHDGDVLNSGALNLSGAAFSCGLTTIPSMSARFLGQ